MDSLSLYWKGAPVPEDDRHAVEQLHDARLPVEQRKAALLGLLASDDVVSRGLALDFCSLLQANRRQGSTPILDDTIDEAVRTCALRELEAPPHERTDPAASLRRGANHASALHALWNNTAAEDAPLLARIFAEHEDEVVLGEATKVAQAALYAEPVVHPDLLAALVRTARRRDLAPEIRGDAIAAIGGGADPTTIPLLVDALQDPELAVSAAAARALLERDLEQHRAFVAPIAAAWRTGEFPPFDVHEVRRLFQGE
jgi:hypothetical protein